MGERPAYLTYPKPEAIHAIAIDNEGNKRFAFGNGKDDKRIFGRSKATLVVMIGEKDGERVNICEGLADCARRATATHRDLVLPQLLQCQRYKTKTSSQHLQSGLSTFIVITTTLDRTQRHVLGERINQHGGTVKKHQDDTAKDPAEASKGK